MIKRALVIGRRIYRINSTSPFDGNENRYPTTAAPVADAIRTDVPSVGEVARTVERQAALQVIVRAAMSPLDTKFREEYLFFADGIDLTIRII
jgi:hypothetical protein